MAQPYAHALFPSLRSILGLNGTTRPALAGNLYLLMLSRDLREELLRYLVQQSWTMPNMELALVHSLGKVFDMCAFIEFPPGGETVLFVDGDGNLVSVDLNIGATTILLPSAIARDLNQLNIHIMTLVASGTRLVTVTLQKRVLCYDLTTHERTPFELQLASSPVLFERIRTLPECVVLSPVDGPVTIWNARSGTTQHTIDVGGDRPAVDFAEWKEETHMVSYSTKPGCDLLLWHLGTATPYICRTKTTAVGVPIAVKFAPGCFVVQDGSSFETWDMSTRQQVRQFTVQQMQMWVIAGNEFVGVHGLGYDDVLKVCNLYTGVGPDRVTGKTGGQRIWSLATAVNGSHIVIAENSRKNGAPMSRVLVCSPNNQLSPANHQVERENSAIVLARCVDEKVVVFSTLEGTPGIFAHLWMLQPTQ